MKYARPQAGLDVQRSRILGSFYGLLSGDALGAPYEFRGRDSYSVSADYVKCTTFGIDIPMGGWTDDSSMALCLLESLLENGGKWNADDCVRRWIKWNQEGYMSVVDHCFDIGIATSRSLHSYAVHLQKYGKLPAVCELSQNPEESMSGNGSLMRLCPVPLLYTQSSPSEVAAVAFASSLPTHASPLCTGACALFALYIHHLTHSGLPTPAERKYAVLDPDFDLLAGADKGVLANPAIEAIRQGEGWRGLPRNQIKTSGFVIHTLQAALWALDTFDTFEKGMMALLTMGADVDTVCCVYGQIAGACYGLEAIPSRWVDGLAKKDMLDDLAGRMVSMIGLNS